MDIVGATGIDRSSMVDLVRRLISLGYLKRRRKVHDVRAYAVRLTPARRRALELGTPVAQPTEKALLASLPLAERQKILDALMTMASAD